MIFSFIYRFCCLEQFQAHTKTEWKVPRCLLYLLPPWTHFFSLIISIIQREVNTEQEAKAPILNHVVFLSFYSKSTSLSRVPHCNRLGSEGPLSTKFIQEKLWPYLSLLKILLNPKICHCNLNQILVNTNNNIQFLLWKLMSQKEFCAFLQNSISC